MLRSRMHVALHDSDGAVPENCRESSEVDTSLSQSRGKGMTKIVKHEFEDHSSFQSFPAKAVVWPVEPCDVMTGFWLRADG